MIVVSRTIFLGQGTDPSSRIRLSTAVQTNSRVPGRKCEGPVGRHIRFAEDQLSPPKYHALLAELSLHTPQRSHAERWAFNYFIWRAAPLFAGIVDGPFWLELIPRLAQSYTFVWDMVITISWAFEHVEYRDLRPVFDTGGLTTTILNAEHRRALKWYSKALVGFRRMLEQGEADNVHGLLSCILFGAFEFQQRNIGNALLLMDNAYKILGENLSNSPAKQITGDTHLDESLTAFTSRKAILMATLATPEWTLLSGQHISGRTNVRTLSVLDKFREHLYMLMFKAYEVIRVTDILAYDDYEMRKLRPAQQRYLQELQQWKDAFVPILASLRDTETRWMWISSYLLMYWGVSHVWLSSCLSPHEVSFDEYMDEFAAIIQNAEDVIDHRAADEINGAIFTGEVQVLLPLYFAATKCRNALLRRKALRLIRKVPPRESVWAALASPRVVEKMIAVEEGHDDFLEHPLTTSILSLPPEERRIHYVAIIEGNVNEGRRHVKLQWHKAVFGVDGSLRMVDESVWLEDVVENPQDLALSGSV
ncbi:hypothetical protein AYO20_05562 [Fonsecaea nubica]|uniref:Uncharacterized protein n=1 Tax=Fonsecaea nubica TaxID=856822 RepID=A0A178D1S4_9EURO|nr:hypothetical protein AYO20_05562 [Fonsecaea nubica]OAL35085.1 hypothetical protein AYO20_05562 [Fonsecaea nubica]